MMKRILILTMGFLFLFLGCTPSPPANWFNAASVIDENGTYHLLYNVNSKNDKFYHLIRRDNYWEQETYSANGSITVAFMHDNDICFSWSSNNGSIACLSNQTLTVIDANLGYKAASILKNGDIFLYERDIDIHSYYLYDPFVKKKKFLFALDESNNTYPYYYIYPYLDHNNTWDGHTLIKFVGSEDKLLKLELLNLNESGVLEIIDNEEFDMNNYPDDNHAFNGFNYVYVRGKSYMLPYAGVIVKVAGDTIQAVQAADYFGDDNLKMLQDIDAVDANGTFHHLKTIQSYGHQELIYEKYIPSQTEPVYSEVIYKDKVKDNTGNLTW